MSQYESHAPTRTLPPVGVEAVVERIGEHDAILDRLYDELAINQREYVDLTHRIRVEEAAVDRLRFGLMRLAGLEEERPE